eukprot:jgi/Tetstr1/430485/TSEL_020293.t1
MISCTSINLRITAGMYYYTVQCHCATPEYLQALRQWIFDELGITVNSKNRKNKKQVAVSIAQKKAQTAWEICKQLWELLLEPVDPTRAPGTAQLPPMHLQEARAQHVKQVAEKFVQAFVNVAGENDAATV